MSMHELETIEVGHEKPTTKSLNDLVDPKSVVHLKRRFGDTEGLIKVLQSDADHGISTSSIPMRVEAYGTNKMPPPVTKSFARFVLIALREKMVLFLLAAALVSCAIGVFETINGDSTGWLEGVVVLIAILIITATNSVNDYRKQKRFMELDSTSKNLQNVRVLRDGETKQIPNNELVVGDIMYIEIGMTIPCDGVLIEGKYVKMDESSITGESDQVTKAVSGNLNETVEAHGLPFDPFVLSGSTVTDGSGRMVVIAVGNNSIVGKAAAGMQFNPPPTEMQLQLTELATNLAKIGLAVGSFTLAALLIIYFMQRGSGILPKIGVVIGSILLATLIAGYTIHGRPKSMASKIFLPVSGLLLIALIAISIVFGNIGGGIIEELSSIIFVGISIIILGVPEGLPLSVTLALAHANINLLKDNCLVRHLAAGEIMGSVSYVVSDKTGTLTQNKMSVVSGTLLGDKVKREDIQNQVDKNSVEVHRLLDNICLNSDAYEAQTPDGRETFLGSKTDVALLNWSKMQGFDYKSERKRDDKNVVEKIPFNSERKRMTTTVRYAQGETITYVKGASETILSMCTCAIHENMVVPMNDTLRAFYSENIEECAKESLRTICCAYSTDGENYVLSALFAIEDPLRKDAQEAVMDMKGAGVTCLMCTGDNVVTARSIAKQCGILTDEEQQVVLEGPDFRALTTEEQVNIAKSVRVMARSSPNDKQLLVNALKKNAAIVGCTGDGSNDSPALKNANVGFAMGSGTDAAKSSADVVVLDDSFASIVRATAWGRAIYSGIRKFIMFQVSINFSSITIVVVTSISTSITDGAPYSGLLALQVLYINLVSDSLAAMMLSTDKPVGKPEGNPRRKEEPFINNFMIRMIAAQAAYQVVMGLLVYYIGPLIWGSYNYPLRTTMVFNTFMFCILFNQLNSRSITTDQNLFRGITKNKFFLPFFIISFILEYPIVTYLGVIFGTVPLNGWMWLFSVVVGTGSLVIGFIVRAAYTRQKNP